MSPRRTLYVVHIYQRAAQKRKLSKIWTMSCDNSEMVRYMTLNDLERRSSPNFAFFSSNSTALLANYVTVVEDRPIMSAKYCLPVSVFHFCPKLTHPAARSLCDSWATCFKLSRQRRDRDVPKTVSRPFRGRGVQNIRPYPWEYGVVPSVSCTVIEFLLPKTSNLFHGQ